MEIFENRDAWVEAFHNGWLKEYRETGVTNFKIYQRPRNNSAPAGRAVDLSTSRLLFITSAGAYLRDSQIPYDAENDLGDYTMRLFPSSTPLDALAYAHTHYDHQYVNADPQVLLPLRHLDDLVRAGGIGALTPNVIAFMGYQPDVSRVVDELIPQIVAAAQQEQADAAVLVPS